MLCIKHEALVLCLQRIDLSYNLSVTPYLCPHHALESVHIFIWLVYLCMPLHCLAAEYTLWYLEIRDSSMMIYRQQLTKHTHIARGWRQLWTSIAHNPLPYIGSARIIAWTGEFSQGILSGILNSITSSPKMLQISVCYIILMEFVRLRD